MTQFNLGEIVRVTYPEKYSDKIYIIKEIKKIRRGGHLYLLKPFDEGKVWRLYYENNGSLLERISS